MSVREELREQINQLLPLPNLLAEKLSQDNHRDEIRERETELKDIMVKLELQAGEEIDKDTGKKIYTNAQQRQVRARELAQKDGDYEEISNRLKSLLDQKAVLAIQIEKIQSEMSARKAVIYALIEMLRCENEKIRADTVKYAVENNKARLEVALCPTINS